MKIFFVKTFCGGFPPATLVGYLHYSASEVPILGADTVRRHPRGVSLINSFKNAVLARGGVPIKKQTHANPTLVGCLFFTASRALMLPAGASPPLHAKRTRSKPCPLIVCLGLVMRECR